MTPPRSNSPKPRILTMEDDEALAQLVKRRLVRQGFDVEIALDGLSGLNMLQATPFDVVVLDYKLPSMDGLDVLSQIMQKVNAPPVIMVSGFSSLEIAIEAIRRGASDYVVKESGGNYLELLCETVKKVLEKQNLLKSKDAAEAALQESILQFRFIANSASDAILSADAQGTIIFWNRGATAIFGYDEDEILGQPLTRLIPKRFHDAHSQAMQRVLTTGEMRLIGQMVEVVAQRKDGAEFPLEISLSSWTIDSKHFFSAVARDITARKNNEQRTQRLLQNQILINALLQLVASPHSLDEQLEIALDLVLSSSWLVTLNKGAIFLYDDLRDELVLKIQKGLHEDLITTCSRVNSTQCVCGAAMASNQLIFCDSNDPRHTVHYDGMIAHAHYCVPIIARERFLGVVNIYMPVGHARNAEEEDLLHTVANTLAGVIERKQLDERLQQAIITADQANSEKGRFLASMSHEIRTPLNVVLGMAELLLETVMSPEQRRFTQSMQSSGKVLLGVINDILDFSRLEAGNVQIAQNPYSPRQVVEETSNLMRMSAERKGLAFGVTVSPLVPEAVLGDDSRVIQVLINLIGNAVKFTHTGRVDVALAMHPHEPETLFFSVTDTGIGINAEQKDRIFEHFIQADAGITRRYGGTGLGLAISQRLVALMGGRLEVTSRLGHGSTFHFSLPMRVAMAPTQQERSDRHPAAPSPAQPLQVLLAEDAEENRMVFAAFFSKSSHQLTMVEDGVQAVNAVKNKLFDVVIMDVQMPNLDGYSATRQIRQWEGKPPRPPVPIIALSAHAMEGEKERSQEAGCTLYLSKPVRKKVLLDALHQVTHPVLA